MQSARSLMSRFSRLWQYIFFGRTNEQKQAKINKWSAKYSVFINVSSCGLSHAKVRFHQRIPSLLN